jgi:peptide/nickel transport system permease protein
MAERGTLKLPADPPSAAIDALGRTVQYLIDHPATYVWRKANTPALEMIATVFLNSAGLLFTALGVATLIGTPLGTVMALMRRFRATTFVLLLSVLAVSMPSFFLAMLLWMLNAQFYRTFDIPGLPAAGFGWDAHLIMPALVLATRPFAQIVQVTYVTVAEILREDFIRTAQSKGLRQRVILLRHVLRNAAVPILTTLSTSMRYSLASLPVVEFFFNWTGVGWTLLQSIDTRQPVLVVDLIVSLGVLFLLINLLLDFLYRLIDPRLRNAPAPAEKANERLGLRERFAGAWHAIIDWTHELRLSITRTKRTTSKLSPLVVSSHPLSDESIGATSGRLVRAALKNPAFIGGTLLVVAFLGLALFGEQLTATSPYATHSGVTKVDGELRAPPFAPTPSFPWGSDLVGRDIQALIFAGAKQTFALALFGAFARVFVGALMGAFAAWWQNSWFDRFVQGAIGVWAAFPATLLAMILILALGIQQGMWVFIVALCAVGWSEVAQTVRSQVSVLKHQQFIEGARAVGTRSFGIVLHHFVPNLVPALLVLAVLELGGVMLLLAELGFLNIFLGGGFRVEIGQAAGMAPVIFYFSDVPEWGALLANIRNWWRSYPWLAWYPGLFFFVAILAFNLWGEGLRRFLDESRINVSRLFNRFTVLGGAAMVVALVWVLQTNAPLSLYAPQARQFDAQLALQDIRQLASPEFQGREAGSADAQRAAEYIAARMVEIGLQPGDQDQYIQKTGCPVFRMKDTPSLELLETSGNVIESFVYRRDMVEYINLRQAIGQGQGRVIGLAMGVEPEANSNPNVDPYGLARQGLREKIILVDETRVAQIRNPRVAAGMLVVTRDDAKLKRRLVYHRDSALGSLSSPILYITPQVADRLLRTAGMSLDQFMQLQDTLEPNTLALTNDGATVRLAIPGAENMEELCYTVVGYLPGIGAQMREAGQNRGMDAQVIMVGAYYDGLGKDLTGAIYPGANDNASGVATMLEIARVMKQATYQPKKTVVFVAWSPGERGDGLSTWGVMQGSRSLNSLTVEAVVELSGVGAGNGSAMALGQGTSFRLAQLAQSAAGQLGYHTTTRGRSPHFGMYAMPGAGGRAALSAFISWDGADQIAHTSQDTIAQIDAVKLEQTGETTLLMLSILSRETEY